MLTARRMSPRFWVVFAFVALRLVHLVLIMDAPAIAQHRWPSSDMSVFVRWSTQIAEGDLLSRQSPMGHGAWNVATTEAWFALHPDDPLRALPLEEASRSQWHAWFGGDRFYQEPLYAYVLAALHVVAGPSPLAALVLQALFGALGLWWMMAWAARALDERTAIVAGVLLTLCGPLAFAESMILRDSMVMTLVWLLLHRFGMANGEAASAWRSWMLVGVIATLLLLGRVTALPLVVFLAAASLWRQTRAQQKTRALGWIVGVTLAFAPVAARNIAVGVTPFSIVGSGGVFALYAGNAAGADPWRGLVVDPVASARILDESGASSGAPASTLAVARATLRTHPDAASFVDLQLRKVAALLHDREIPDNASYALYRVHAPILFLLPFGFGLAAPFGALGAWVALRQRRGRIAVVVVVTMLALPLLLQPLSRYRWAVLAALVPLAALALVWFLEQAGAGRRRPFTVALIIVLLSVALMHRPIDIPPTRAADHLVAWDLWALPRASPEIEAGDNDAVAETMRLYLRGEPLARDLNDPAVTRAYETARSMRAEALR